MMSSIESPRLRLVRARILSRKSHEALLAHPTLTRLEPVTQKLEPMTLQPAIPNVGFVGMQVRSNA